MGWRGLLQEDVQNFIAVHIDDDVRQLALKKAPDASWSYPMILDQIKVRQRAKVKSPILYETNGFVFPKSGLYEQASSEACAKYKASLAAGECFVDLTSGAGIDSFFLSQNFKRGWLVERDEESSDILSYNTDILKESDFTSCDLRVAHQEAEEFLKTLDEVDLIYLDPQRRISGKKALFELEACSPDILRLLPVLKEKTKRVLLKTSPILDIGSAAKALNWVTKVHVVQWQGECKEVLYELQFDLELSLDQIEVNAVEIDDSGNILKKFSYVMAEEKNENVQCALPKKYIYEPGPAFQKAGGFKSMARAYGFAKIHMNSHIYTSEERIEGFPGKIYEVQSIVSAKEKAIPIEKADLIVRNFPEKAEKLKKRLKIKDGGKHRIFATTLCDETKKLIICLKL